MSYIKDTYKELMFWASNISDIKTFLVALGFIISIGGHIWGSFKLKNTSDRKQVYKDSCVYYRNEIKQLKLKIK